MAIGGGKANFPLTGAATASAASGVMTVTGTFTGSLAVGDQISGATVPAGTVITSFGTGTGGTGTYNIAVAASPPTGSTSWLSTTITAGPKGRALIYVDASASSTAESAACSFYGLQGEQGFPIQQYGIYFGNNATANVTHIGWTIDSCNLTNGGSAIGQGANITLDNVSIRNISQQVGGGLNLAGTVQNSTIQYDALTGAALFATFKNSAYIGDSVKSPLPPPQVISISLT